MNYNFDSLQKVIAARPEERSSGKAYLYYATKFYYSNRDSGMFYLEKAAKLAERTGDPDLAAECLKSKGDLFSRVLRTHEDSIVLALHYIQLFDLYRAQGFLEDAIYYGEQGYQLWVAMVDDQELILQGACDDAREVSVYGDRVQGA